MTYNECFLALKNNKPFYHNSGRFFSRSSRLIFSFDRLIAERHDDGVILILAKPTNQVDKKHFAVVERYRNYEIERKKREALRRD